MDPSAAVPALHLYDTRRRAVSPLEPIEPGRVGIYTCGPTVYAPQHLGNMRSQLAPDLLRRYLLATGLEVTYITNITDVGHLVGDADVGDDKVEAAAQRAGATVAAITSAHTEQWLTDRRLLGCLEPDELPRASEHVVEQMAMITELEDQGRTYRIADGIYFDVSTFDRYAEFAGIDLEALESTGRVDTADKRHPADFALWKLSPPGSTRLQEWESPWGVGFPGWHIECSAMATKYLGDHIDVHTGGIDHVRVHHTNEIAQSECALGVHPWVGHWMHNEFLDLGGEKLSKSAGHSLGVGDLVSRGIDPLAFRLFFLQAHYRQQQSFTFDHVTSAGTALRRLVHHAAMARDAVGGDATADDATRTAPLRAAFWASLADDLNAPRALSVVWEIVRDRSLSAADRWSLLADFDRVLGFGLADAADPEAGEDLSQDPAVVALLADRETARQERDFATADRIRDELAAQGLEIVDTPDGPQARRRSG